jgi:hypothetical protein
VSPSAFELTADAGRGPGYALLRLNTRSNESTDSVQCMVQRNQDGYYLTQDGQWLSTQATLQIEATSDSDGLLLCLGPGVIDPILSDTRSVYRLHMQLDGHAISGVLRISSGLYPSGASRPMPEVIPPVSVVEPINLDTPTPTPSPEPPRRSKALPILLLLLVLAAAGVAAWWFTQKPAPEAANGPSASTTVTAITKSPETGVTNTAPTPPPALEPPLPNDPTTRADSAPAPMINGVLVPAACSATALEQASDEYAYLQSCTQAKPATEQIQAIIAAGKQQNRCDLIQRLYAYTAQGGDTAIALAYAQEFDPKTFAGGCFKQPDAKTALYWYEIVLQQDPTNKLAKDRIAELTKKEAP